MNEQLKEILKNISSSGNASEDKTIIKHLLGKNLNHILNLSSGSHRIHSHILNKFSLIINQPQSLSDLNPFEIRCSLCKVVVSYPCWYYEVKYNINVFHYFVCFNRSEKVNCSCFRKG